VYGVVIEWLDVTGWCGVMLTQVLSR